MSALTVSQLIEAINLTLEQLENVIVEGEVTEFKIIHNKWVTFQLKDAESAIGCFMTVWQYKTAVEDGMMVRAQGKPNLRNKGFFSFVVTSLQPTGEGALRRAFELLREKLTAAGLFAPERKRLLPRFPENIVLITSKDAAAYNDFLKVLKGRQGGLTIHFLHTQVQGADAPRQLKAALEYANTHLAEADALVMIRGGGSMEDLQAFNDESVVEAVAASRIPTVVGIGHERDITLAELAADVRASTPSNAAELLVKSQAEISLAIRQLEEQIKLQIKDDLASKRQVVTHAVTVMRTRARVPQQQVTRLIENLQAARHRLNLAMSLRQQTLNRWQGSMKQQWHQNLSRKQELHTQLSRILNSFSPKNTLKRGYSITRLRKGQVVHSITDVRPGSSLTIEVTDGTIHSRVNEVADDQLPLYDTTV